MKNNKEILSRAKRLRNINSCIIAEVENGKRIEINPEVIIDFIGYLTYLDNEELTKDGIDIEIRDFFVVNLYNLITKDNFEMRLR